MIKYIKKDKSVLKYIIGIEKRQVEVSKFFGINGRRLLLGPPSACRSLGLGILARCGKILTAVQPASYA